MKIFENYQISKIYSCVPSNKKKEIKENIYFDVKKTIGVNSSYHSLASTTLDLCYKASTKLIKENKINKNKIDVIIFVTQTPDYLMPSNANILISKLKINNNPPGFDINQGCSGFIYGLWTALSIMNSNNFKNCLLLVGDTITRSVKENDKKNYLLFGDAGSAVFLNKKKGSKISFILGSENYGNDKLVLKNSGFRRDSNMKLSFFMNGTEVFIFAIKTVPGLIKLFLKKNNIKISMIDYFIFHQANEYMIQKICELAKIENRKVLSSIKDYGNTSSASIPITINKNKSKFKKNNKLIIIGFGAGFSYGISMINIKNDSVGSIIKYHEK